MGRKDLLLTFVGPGEVRGEKGEGALVMDEIRKGKWSLRPSGHSRSMGKVGKEVITSQRSPGHVTAVLTRPVELTCG